LRFSRLDFVAFETLYKSECTGEPLLQRHHGLAIFNDY
jgi:hypothetical protein